MHVLQKAVTFVSTGTRARIATRHMNRVRPRWYACARSRAAACISPKLCCRALCRFELPPQIHFECRALDSINSHARRQQGIGREVGEPRGWSEAHTAALVVCGVNVRDTSGAGSLCSNSQKNEHQHDRQRSRSGPAEAAEW